MSATCTKCGDCCEAIPFNSTLEQVKADLEDPALELTERGVEDLSFILNNWVIISRREYDNVHPKMPTDKQRFRCIQFNQETRECMVHDSRPPVCQDYPWYNRDPANYTEEYPPSLPARCSFWADVAPELVPEWVEVFIGNQS